MPTIPIGPLIVFLIGTSLYSFLFVDSGKSEIFKTRKKQSLNMRTNSFRLKFKEYADGKVKYSKRVEKETLCLNAGLDWSYSDFLMVCVGISLFFLVFFIFIVGNVYMAVIFAIFGYTLPEQLIGLIRTKRLAKLEKQIGPFMNMVIKRYEFTEDFEKSLIGTTKEFYGTEPLYTELSKTVSEVAVGISISEALDNLSKRTANKYLKLLADYYKIAYTLGTDEVRKKLLGQAYVQYEENRKMKSFLKEQISEPIRDSYLMVGAVPLFFGFGVLFINDYLDFMLNDPVGQIGMAVCSMGLLVIIIFINKVIGAPLDRHEKKKKQ